MPDQTAARPDPARPSPQVSVVVTAYDAEATIADAVRSALAEPEVAEVIVVDDASRDATAHAAAHAAGGDPRLVVLRQPRNGGPAAARNRAFAAARGDFVAVLDADDFVLPGRFARLLAVSDWDLVADNILFVTEATVPDDLPPVPRAAGKGVIDIDLNGFVRANLSSKGSARHEWGFLKPVIRLDFLRRHRLRYDERLRLGEDYDLYVRMLQAGARFRAIRDVGYAARWRENSLSSRHRTEDLEALWRASESHLAAWRAADGGKRGGTDGGAAVAALADHRRDLHHRFALRDFLDNRARMGRAGAMVSALRQPETILPIARGILRDKLAARRPDTRPTRIGRLLIED